MKVGRSISIRKTAEGWKTGDWVFAYWDTDDYWYPAEITGIDGDDITVRFDDGTTITTDTDYLDELTVDEGDELWAWSEEDEDYYWATVKSVNGEKVQVEYDDDGSKEWVSVYDLAYDGYWMEGDRVWAYWDGDEYWYPATITSTDDDYYYITFDDENEEIQMDEDSLDNLYVEEGDEVEAWWEDDEQYYPATVLAVKDDSEEVQVEYEDGTQWTELTNLRLASE